jgi:hypothetical protein
VFRFDRRCEVAAGRRRLEPWAKLRMNPAHMYSRLCSPRSVEGRGLASVRECRLRQYLRLRMNPRAVAIAGLGSGGLPLLSLGRACSADRGAGSAEPGVRKRPHSERTDHGAGNGEVSA